MKEEITYRDIKGAQLGRDTLETLVHEPFFEDFVKNLYVRLYIGDNRSRGKPIPVYRVCQIKQTETNPNDKPYQLTKNQHGTDTWLVLTHGANHRSYKISAVSNAGMLYEHISTLC